MYNRFPYTFHAMHSLTEKICFFLKFVQEKLITLPHVQLKQPSQSLVEKMCEGNERISSEVTTC